MKPHPPAKKTRSSPGAQKKVEVTYFHKPADRSRTLPTFEAPAPRETPRERERRAQTREDTPAPKKRPRPAGGRRRSTLETPAVTASAPEQDLATAKTEPEFRAVTIPESASDRKADRRALDQLPANARGRSHAQAASEGHSLKNRDGKAMGPAQIAELSLFGHHLFEKGRVAEARVVFEGLVDLGVEDAFPHTMLGIIYLSEGSQDRALALFEAALAHDPEDVAARVYRAEIRLARGRVKQAVEDLGKLLNEVDADNPFADRARKLLESAGGAPSGKSKKRK